MTGDKSGQVPQLAYRNRRERKLPIVGQVVPSPKVEAGNRVSSVEIEFAGSFASLGSIEIAFAGV